MATLAKTGGTVLSSDNNGRSIHDLYYNDYLIYEATGKKVNKFCVYVIIFCILILITSLLVKNYFDEKVLTFIGILSFVLSVLCGFVIYLNSTVVFRFNSSFTCPHCYKNIVPSDFIFSTCPYCDHEEYNFDQVILGCNNCNEPLRFLDCPYCKKDIDLYDTNYNIHKIRSQRYERK